MPRRDDRKTSLKDVCFELMDGVVGSNSSTAFNDALAAITAENVENLSSSIGKNVSRDRDEWDGGASVKEISARAVCV